MGALTKLDISNNNIEQGEALKQIIEYCNTKGIELDNHESNQSWEWIDRSRSVTRGVAPCCCAWAGKAPPARGRSPVLRRAGVLTGCHMTELPLHDSARDLLFMSETRAAEAVRPVPAGRAAFLAPY